LKIYTSFDILKNFMAKIKLTKTELKAQTDALKRFQRFLPMLQLKKQQLQAEIAAITHRLEQVLNQEQTERQALNYWIALFSESAMIETPLVTLDRIVTDTSNIAGVTIPVFREVQVTPAKLDLFATPPWMDAGIKVATRFMSLKAQCVVYERQRDLVIQELHATAQRVNLFEKIKIPECKENIRIIKIAIGDAQIAAVTRGKIAKGRGRMDEMNMEMVAV
jgi:V/A-type H+-transporting ATPase subunit D